MILCALSTELIAVYVAIAVIVWIVGSFIYGVVVPRVLTKAWRSKERKQ
jgi:tellurite resistance protein TehA-like permease